MNLVSLDTLNAKRFPDNPVPAQKLQRWCRNGILPARKIGGEWYVDLDEFDAQGQPKQDPQQFAKDSAVDILRKIVANAASGRSRK